MQYGLVCPLSMCGANVKQCHPACKMLDEQGNCMLVSYVEKTMKESKEKQPIT